MVPRVGNETLRPLGFGAMLRTQASDEEAYDVFARPSLYCGRAGSDVMGCRRPTDGVFSYVSSGTSHAGGVKTQKTDRRQKNTEFIKKRKTEISHGPKYSDPLLSI